jgi:hypothetical protein
MRGDHLNILQTIMMSNKQVKKKHKKISTPTLVYLHVEAVFLFLVFYTMQALFVRVNFPHASHDHFLHEPSHRLLFQKNNRHIITDTPKNNSTLDK